MTKNNLQSEMASALKAAVAYSKELEALKLEAKNAEDPTRERQMRIRAIEKSWMEEMNKHSEAYKQLCSLKQASRIDCHGVISATIYGQEQAQG